MFEKCVAMTSRPEWDCDVGQDLARAQARAHCSLDEIIRRYLARAGRACDMHGGIVQNGERRKLTRRIELAQAAADGATVARLPVTDVLYSLSEYRGNLSQAIVQLN